MEPVGIVCGVVLKGKLVYDILKAFTGNKIQMNAQKDDWSKSENKVLFKAEERPIRHFVTQGFKDYPADQYHMDLFKQSEAIF
jgi:hypothetical protein